MDLVRPIRGLSAADLILVGGKGANLGELVAAGFPVPDGFVLTTAAYERSAQSIGIEPERPAEAAQRLRGDTAPAEVTAAVVAAYRKLGEGRVAVRSSATAEDLPGASFAGQQDSYLGVEGERRLIEAVRRCWASLWNERAVAYRRAHGVDPAGVRLAVVVQRMVEASAAGVMFTADPVTGRRRVASIDSVTGLGEALVSGAVNPDHDTVDVDGGAVLTRHPAAPIPVLSESELARLADLAGRIERHFGTPQDVEFALDQDRRIWLVQSRPITTLYPLPKSAPKAAGLRAYWSISVFQGYLEPVTPMGMQLFRLLGAGLWGLVGQGLQDPAAGPPLLVEAGLRPYLDVTPIVRDRLGGRLMRRMLGIGETRSAAAFEALATDPRLTPGRRARAHSLWLLVRALWRAGVPQSALRVARRPETMPEHYIQELHELARVELTPHAGAVERLDAFEHLMLDLTPQVFRRMLGLMLPTILSPVLVGVVLRGRATASELQVLTRGGTHNPTLEMDLALWSLSRTAAGDEAARTALVSRTPEALTAAYREGALPEALQAGLTAFLRRYGFRAIGEIDLGVPRWSEDPGHLLGVLASYVGVSEDAPQPDARVAAAARESEAMAGTLLGRTRGVRRLVLRALLRRVRALSGYREAPKFQIIRLVITPARELVLGAGAGLAASAYLAEPDDILYLTLPEARRAAGGEDLRDLVAARKEAFARERRRRYVPRVLLSDGTDAEAALVTGAGGLTGTAASPGLACGQARVITSPAGARLEPGEILIAPSTDPGWTPLFMTAGGLVMEMGGMMSHGAVVAREYGIPAVVGVAGATERIRSGSFVRLDGSAGTVAIVNEERSGDEAAPAPAASDSQPG